MNVKKLLIAIALIAPTLASADDDINKALRQIDEEEARIFKMEFDKAKRDCDDHNWCTPYKIMLGEAKRRLLQQRDKVER